jgi:glycosyltransferase involved in cell wall biosynthesis
LVNMSTSESFGMVLLEAWVAGRPVVANTDCSAFRDLAVHEVNSLLVSAETLGAALERLAADEGLCKKLGDAGRSTASEYSWPNVGNMFFAHCKRLASQSCFGISKS